MAGDDIMVLIDLENSPEELAHKGRRATWEVRHFRCRVMGAISRMQAKNLECF